jgi:hypothetical protein
MGSLGMDFAALDDQIAVSAGVRLSRLRPPRVPPTDFSYYFHACHGDESAEALAISISSPADGTDSPYRLNQSWSGKVQCFAVGAAVRRVDVTEAAWCSRVEERRMWLLCTAASF